MSRGKREPSQAGACRGLFSKTTRESLSRGPFPQGRPGRREPDQGRTCLPSVVIESSTAESYAANGKARVTRSPDATLRPSVSSMLPQSLGLRASLAVQSLIGRTVTLCRWPLRRLRATAEQVSADTFGWSGAVRVSCSWR